MVSRASLAFIMLLLLLTFSVIVYIAVDITIFYKEYYVLIKFGVELDLKKSQFFHLQGNHWSNLCRRNRKLGKSGPSGRSAHFLSVGNGVSAASGHSAQFPSGLDNHLCDHVDNWAK
ncbi:hypothetical protein JHK87_012172 [Glycine soja]|nr:hypothetical protein JHK87_012172 [Glycine soja]